MPTVTEEIRTTTVVDRERETGFGPPAAPPSDPGGGDDGRGGRGPSFPVSKARVLLWMILAVAVMLFAGLTSAYIVLRSAPSWQSVLLPNGLWVNTFVLLASSLTMEMARKRISGGRPDGAKRWMGATLALGLAFLVGQVVVWNEMVAAGVYLASTLHSSFMYVLTGTHALHVLGGLGAIALVTVRIFNNRYTKTSHEPVVLTATFWHAMGGLWVYLFLLLELA
jgi:cytochrome c oxidase subunit 3